MFFESAASKIKSKGEKQAHQPHGRVKSDKRRMIQGLSMCQVLKAGLTFDEHCIGTHYYSTARSSLHSDVILFSFGLVLWEF